MELIAFASFFILVLAWLMAPAGEPADVPSVPAMAPAPTLAVSEARA